MRVRIHNPGLGQVHLVARCKHMFSNRRGHTSAFLSALRCSPRALLQGPSSLADVTPRAMVNLYDVREARQKFVGGVQMEETVVQLLLFADNLMLVAENDEDMEINLRVLDEGMEKWKNQINWRKTKVLIV